MAGTTYSKFFWQDWAGDPNLILCSPSAQALWMRLLALAAVATPTGHVKVNGAKPTIKDLHEITRFPADQIQGWMDELVAPGVCDVTREGILVSRRMVRDTRKRLSAVKGGKARQRQILEEAVENHGSSSMVVQPPSAISQSPSAISQKNAAAPLKENLSKVDRLSEALGVNLTTMRNPQNAITDIVAMEQDGVDFELDLLAAAREWAARPGRREFSSISYFGPKAREKRDARRAREQLEGHRAANLEPITDEVFARFLRNGIWMTTRFGPSPVEEGCRATPEQLSAAQTWWDRRGQRPLDVDPVLWPHKGPVPFWNVVPLAKQA